jgi:hypothetical protein
MSETPSPAAPPRRKWPILRFLWKRVRPWLERHQHPFNFWVHMVGIPTAVVGLLVLLTLPWNGLAWYWGLGGLIVGYLLQWAGHAVEGNDVGEWAGIKRLLGLPYVAISPRYQPFPPLTDTHRPE